MLLPFISTDVVILPSELRNCFTFDFHMGTAMFIYFIFPKQLVIVSTFAGAYTTGPQKISKHAQALAFNKMQ